MSAEPKPVSPLQFTDAAALCAIAGQSFPETWSEKDFRYFLTHPHRVALGVYSDGGELLAYFVGILVQGDLDVVSLATLPAHRKKGMARLLLLAALADERVERAFLEVRISNGEAKQLYEAAGFKAMGIRKKYYGGVEDALQLRWTR